jgi:hypothetical protein
VRDGHSSLADERIQDVHMHISDNNQTDNRTVAAGARATRISNPPSPFDSRGSSEPWKCDDGCMSSLLSPPLTRLCVCPTDDRYGIGSCRHDDQMPPHDELHHCDPESTADSHPHGSCAMGSCAMEILFRLLFISTQQALVFVLDYVAYQLPGGFWLPFWAVLPVPGCLAPVRRENNVVCLEAFRGLHVSPEPVMYEGLPRLQQ